MIAPAKQSRLKGYLLLCLATSWEMVGQALCEVFADGAQQLKP